MKRDEAEVLLAARRARRLRLTALAIVVVGLFGVVVAHVALTQNQFHLSRLQARADEEQARYDRLRLEVAELEAPGRISDVAQNRLGMVTPSTIRYLTPSPEITAAPIGSEPDARSGEGDAPTDASPSWTSVKPHHHGG